MNQNIDALFELAEHRRRTEHRAPGIFATGPALDRYPRRRSHLPLWAPAGQPIPVLIDTPSLLSVYTKYGDEAALDNLIRCYARHLAASTTGTTVTYHERGKGPYAIPRITITARDRFDYDHVAGSAFPAQPGQINRATSLFFEALDSVTGGRPTPEERRAARMLARYGDRAT